MTNPARPRERFPPLALVAALLTVGCSGSPPEVPPAAGADADGHSPATEATAEANHRAARSLALEDGGDLEAAERGFIARDEDLVIRGDDGRVIWSPPAYDFVEGGSPDSVHPGLWRQAKLNKRHGLYRVADRVYQVRGYDLSNMAVIEGDRGYIVVDPLTAEETARAAMALVVRELGDRPITAIIFTHSHADHFGGVGGVVSSQEIEARGIRVLAPARFIVEATSENVLGGMVMGRRAEYMFGRPLARSPRGHVDSGLGKEPALGRIGIAAPTESIDATPTELEIDGVRFVFQHVPESEAPAEMTFFLPRQRAFCGAEIVSHTLHNLYTLRGAKVRDALAWSGYIDQAIELFGPDIEVLFGSHHWPTWGNRAAVEALERQRDLYKYLHDQTIRLANRGLTPREIAEEIELPASLREHAERGYYGTVRHNAKAVYQRYFGWYDGNPARLDPLPPVEEAKRYVESMGGAEAVLAKAERSFAEGDYRWTATVLDHLVFAEPGNVEARALLARTYDQLGYRAESGPWRDEYLTAAYELRHGRPEMKPVMAGAAGLLARTPTARFLEALATRVDGPAAEGREFVLNLVLTDVGETWVLELGNSVLHHRRRPADPEADATLEITRSLWLAIMTGRAGLRDVLFGDEVAVRGSRLELLRFFTLLERPDPGFAIVTP